MKNKLTLITYTLILFYLSACSISKKDYINLEEKYLSNSKIKNEEEKILFLEAMHSYDKELYSIAKKSLQKFTAEYPLSTKHSESVLKIADCDFFAGKYPEAISNYENFIKTFPNSKQNSWARKQISHAYLNQYKGKNRDQKPLINAATSFKKLLVNYPESNYKNETIEILIKLKEKKAAHEAGIVSFYLKQKNLNAAASRLAYLRKNFLGSPALLELEKLIKNENFLLEEELEGLVKIAENSTKKDTVFDF